MKILILTQRVDLDDPILGFFHFWLVELAEFFQELKVICLYKGQSFLPSNVELLSLGKESGQSRFKYLFRFYKYIWLERKNYDVVFVHMNQEYVLLAGWLWYCLGKKVFLWRNHPQGNFLTKLAIMMSDQVFCTSPQSFTASYSKNMIMPVGIDTDFFRPQPDTKKIPRSILSLGRISKIKRLDLLIEALLKLKQKGVLFKASIVGSPLSSKDKRYEQDLKIRADLLIRTGCLRFIPAISQSEAVGFYRSHQIFVNLTPLGSMDKTIFEAMSCGLPVVINNQPLVDNLDQALVEILDLSEGERNKQGQINRQQIKEKHSLKFLVQSLVQVLHNRSND